MIFFFLTKNKEEIFHAKMNHTLRKIKRKKRIMIMVVINSIMFCVVIKQRA